MTSIKRLAACIFICALLTANMFASGEGTVNASFNDKSYAWTSEMVYMTHWYLLEQEELLWKPIRFDLYGISRKNGNVELLLKNIEAGEAQLYAEGSNLYITQWTWESREHGYLLDLDYYVYCHSDCKITQYSIETNEILDTYSFQMDEQVMDIAVYCGKTYVVTTESIYRLDGETPVALYTFDVERTNQYYRHTIIEDNVLYFQEDNTICSLNLVTNEVKKIINYHPIETLPYEQWNKLENVARNTYDYIVKDGILYYYDAITGTTKAFDTRTGEEFEASDEGYHFAVFTDDIIKANTVAVETSEGEIEYTSVSHMLRINENGKLESYSDWDEWTNRSIQHVPIGSGEYLIIEYGYEETMPNHMDIMKY